MHATSKIVDQPDQKVLGRRKVGYLGHQVSLAELEAHPKELGSLLNISLPRTLRSMQSFLGILNYYSRFIEDFAIYAPVIYELREADFHEIRRMDEAESSTRDGKRADDRKCIGDHDPKRNGATRGDPKFSGAARGNPNRNIVTGGNLAFPGVAGGDLTYTDRSRWDKAMISFTLLRDKIDKAPILKRFDPERPPVIVVYASKWAVSTALLQEHDGVYWLLTFTSRTLKPNEITYGIM